MNEDVLDVLLYLFEQYAEKDVPSPADPRWVRSELTRAGFAESAVDKALVWLEGLADGGDASSTLTSGSPSTRIFAREETERLDVGARGFILFLEQAGVLDPVRREVVIDRAMALDTEEVDLPQIRWVVQMVLMSQSGVQGNDPWLESLMLDPSAGALH
jgi:Smg protein